MSDNRDDALWESYKAPHHQIPSVFFGSYHPPEKMIVNRCAHFLCNGAYTVQSALGGMIMEGTETIQKDIDDFIYGDESAGVSER